MSEGNAIEPVTVVVRRRVKKGHEADYERWLARVIRDASGLPGYMGADVIRPGPSNPREYTSIFRFDSVEHLTDFEESELRRKALAEVGAYVEADAVWQKHTGLEVWFTAPPGAMVPKPSRFRMTLLLMVVLYGLGIPLAELFGYLLTDVPIYLRLLVTVPFQVALMTYAVMPALTRWLARWIYPVGPNGRN